MVHPRDIGQLARESTHEAERALSELKESVSILLYKLGEAVGIFRSTFPVDQKENAAPQFDGRTRGEGAQHEAKLDVGKAQHHGDLFRGKSLT